MAIGAVHLLTCLESSFVSGRTGVPAPDSQGTSIINSGNQRSGPVEAPLRSRKNEERLLNLFIYDSPGITSSSGGCCTALESQPPKVCNLIIKFHIFRHIAPPCTCPAQKRSIKATNMKVVTMNSIKICVYDNEHGVGSIKPEITSKAESFVVTSPSSVVVYVRFTSSWGPPPHHCPHNISLLD